MSLESRNYSWCLIQFLFGMFEKHIQNWPVLTILPYETLRKIFKNGHFWRFGKSSHFSKTKDWKVVYCDWLIFFLTPSTLLTIAFELLIERLVLVLILRAVSKWLSKVITWLRLLRLMIGLQDSRQFFSLWEAKQIAPCTRDFSRASSELQGIATNWDWFIALFAPVVIGRSNYFGFGFSTVIWKRLYWLKNWRESFKPITKRSNRNHAITFDSLLKTALKLW